MILSTNLPVGAELERILPGLTDAIRSTWPRLLPERPITNPKLGIELPIGSQLSLLPAGLTDYLRDHRLAYQRAVAPWSSVSSQFSAIKR